MKKFIIKGLQMIGGFLMVFFALNIFFGLGVIIPGGESVIEDKIFIYIMEGFMFIISLFAGFTCAYPQDI